MVFPAPTMPDAPEMTREPRLPAVPEDLIHQPCRIGGEAAVLEHVQNRTQSQGLEGRLSHGLVICASSPS